MRLSADILSQAEQRPNALGERELILRSLGIPELQHLATTRNQFDAFDLTNNRLTSLSNFPKLTRLGSLYCAGNLIEVADGGNLGKNVPNLRELCLMDNKVVGLDVVKSIGEGCKKLEFLSLMGNPVTRRQHYRLYTINKIPTLKVLDFIKIKDSERQTANRLAQSAAGAALESDVQLEAASTAKEQKQQQNGVKTFTPGEGESAKESFVVNFTPEQKLKIKEMISGAASPEEIERIEACVKRGEFPGSTNNNGNGGVKRPVEANDSGNEGFALKKIKT